MPFTFLILAAGLAAVAAPSGIMANALSRAREEMGKAADSIEDTQ